MESIYVNGRRLERPVNDLEQDVLGLITDEFYSHDPDEYLMNILADVVLLCREWSDTRAATILPNYQSLGGTFRERERVKRKMVRWVTRLQRLPLRERHALQAAIAHLR